MPVCPKCQNKLIKRKSDRAYHCRRHGKVRDIEDMTRYRTEYIDPDTKVEYRPFHTKRRIRASIKRIE